MKSQPTPDSLELGRLLRRAARAATKVYRRGVREMGLTTRQAAAILALVEAPGKSLSDLAETLGADQATASALVDRLLAASLVKRETDPDDRRRASLLPTEQALELATSLARSRFASEQQIRAVLGEDSETLAHILSRLIDGLEDKREAGTLRARA